jgi:hypothetical protein
VLAIYISGILLLAWAWWRIRGSSLAWALTITWSLALNVYTPIYDATLLVIPAFLVADHLYRADSESLPDTFKFFLLTFYTLPLTYPFLANAWGFQVFTVLIIGFGLYQIRLLSAPAVASFSREPSLSVSD